MSIEVFSIISTLGIFLGAIIQASMGIGFSVIVAPIMMIQFGVVTAIPLLLILNIVISAIATDKNIWNLNKIFIIKALKNCFIGIALGIIIYPLLSEQLILSITAILLLIGIISSFYNFESSLRSKWFKTTLGMSGLATVWAASPGPLMMMGLIINGQHTNEARKIIHPLALIIYSSVFVLHLIYRPSSFIELPLVVEYSLITILGSSLGRVMGYHLPQRLISISITLISIIGCLALIYRAYSLG